jgi:Flp pilus assembly protein TadG
MVRRGNKSLIAIRTDQEGQALVEFMLSITFLMILIMSIFEILAFIYTYSVMADAAKEGVRYAIVHGTNSGSPSGPSTQATVSNPPCTASSSNVTNVVAQVQNFAGFSLHDTSNISVFVCYLDGNNKLNSLVEVTVNYPFRPFFGLSWPSTTVNANSAGRIVF